MTDNTEIEKLRSELRVSEENLQALMDNLVDGLIVIGAVELIKSHHK